MKSVKTLAIAGAAAAIIILGGMNLHLIALLHDTDIVVEDVAEHRDELQAALTEYKAVYDGITVYEDGTWLYNDGVEEYWFWNWDTAYIKE